MPLVLFNTLGREKQEFIPFDANNVRMYTCGPTVYNYAHLGNLRAYVFADVLRRTLLQNQYTVKQVMNITDIGHLTDDADQGEDKMTKGLIREGKELNLKNMRKLAEFYTARFNEDLASLNILPPDGQYYASDYVAEDMALIERLETKGYTYKTSDGLYFDTSMMPDYGELWGGKRKTDDEYRRVNQDAEKKNPEDFALWKFNQKLGYPSPWGNGFPGWHIECSAMGLKFLGEQFDIHTGGIDHISIHHTNEIAQSECATGKKPFVKYWLHNDFVDTGGEKMAKSDDNFLRLQSVLEKGLNPITYRFWLLMASYHTKVNFSWEALESSEAALRRLYRLFLGLGQTQGKISQEYMTKFMDRVNDDLDTPRALSLLWLLIADEEVSPADRRATILEFDKVLGLGFDKIMEEEIVDEVMELVKRRAVARAQKNFDLADQIRKEINALGYEINDTPEGQKISKL